MQSQQTPPIPEPASPPVSTAPFEVPNLIGNAKKDDQVVANSNNAGNPEIADDGDLIEKDWIAKIKQIIGTTQHDPYQQSRQFTQLKVDYLQKRYGKIIKTEE